MTERLRLTGRGMLVAFFSALGVVLAFGAGPCDRDSGVHWCEKPQTATAVAAVPGQFPWVVSVGLSVGPTGGTLRVEATLTGGPPGQGQAKVVEYPYTCGEEDPPDVPLFEWEDPALGFLGASLTKPSTHSWSKAAAKGLVVVAISP